VLGTDRHPAPRTSQRIALLERVTERLLELAAIGPVDGVLFPGGYFRLKSVLGLMPIDDRLTALRHSPPTTAILAALDRLDVVFPGITLVIGIDSHALDRWFAGDQMVTAWQRGALVGYARKAFPVWTEIHHRAPMVWVTPEDVDQPLRLVRLRNDRLAILCACYDGFGLRAAVDPRFADQTSIRWIREPGQPIRWFYAAERPSYIERWASFLRAHPPDLALIAIHHFARPGRDCYWQRHGIAGASAALDGIPILGAAHFREHLPAERHVSPLVSADVPRAHLFEGHFRRAHPIFPLRLIPVLSADGRTQAVIRLFFLHHRFPRSHDP